MKFSEVKYGAATSIGDSVRDAIVQDDPERWRQVYQEVRALPRRMKIELAAVAMAAAGRDEIRPHHASAYRIIGKTDPTEGNQARWG